MSKSNKYGYVGVDIPEQSFGNNKGIFNPAEINELVADNKWTQYGQLELIETQTVSSGTAADFLDLGNYNVHFVTYNNINSSSTTELQIVLSNDSGSTFITSNYQNALQYMNASGSVAEVKSTSASALRLGNRVGNNRPANGYAYLYNLLDSTKYSFCTSQSASRDTDAGANGRIQFGGSVYTVAETINAIRVYIVAGAINKTGTISLYGKRTYE